MKFKKSISLALVMCMVLSLFASFVVSAEDAAEKNVVNVNVNENAMLTDGVTGFTAGWGDVGTSKVALINNTKCTTQAMDVVVSYDLGEVKAINALALDFYHDANVMIGYPEGQILVEVSADGESWAKVGLFDITEAEVVVGTPGTVSTVCEFNAVKAANVRATFKVGSSTGVLGDSPADGKVFWEFCSIAEVTVTEANLVEVDVSDYAQLTDGVSDFTAGWTDVGNTKVALINNAECKTNDMDVVVTYDLGEVKGINALVLDFYHCADVMIGYPQGKILVEVSVDGEAWTKVGLYDIAEAEVALGAPGTVSTVCEFAGRKAQYVRATFEVGASTGVLGDSPADGKVFWEFCSLAEISVTEATVDSPIVTAFNVAGYLDANDAYIFTDSDIYANTSFPWWDHVAFAPVDGLEGVYEVTEMIGGSVGEGKPVAIPEGGFAWIAWISAAEGTGANAKAVFSTISVGDYVQFTGLDIENCTATADATAEKYIDPNAPVNVALDKTYTLSGCGERDSYFAKLTDGVAVSGLTYNNTDWFGFYCNGDNASVINAPDHIGTVVIDLEEVSDLSSVRVNTFFGSTSGITNPTAVVLSVSEDGETFTEVETKNYEVATESSVSWITFDLEDVSARYVKLDFTLYGSFVFINEIEVYNVPVVEEPELEEVDGGDLPAHNPRAHGALTVPANTAISYTVAFENGANFNLYDETISVLVNGEALEFGMLGFVATLAKGDVVTLVNEGAEAVELYPSISEVIFGTMGNPIVLEELGDITANVTEAILSDGGAVHYVYTATVNGTLTITMPEGNWTYTVNNLTTFVYGDSQWSDSDPVLSTYTIDVAEGDEIQIIVGTYDPDSWAAPEGEIVFNVVEEEAAPEAPEDPKEIVDDAFALESGAELPYVATLTGEIVKINTPYSEQYGNITVTIEVEGTDGVKELLCYRIKGEGADTLAVGDTITVTGTIINYNGTIEYAAGSTVDAIVKGEGEAPVAPEDPKEIVDAAFGLEEGASLPYMSTLTGVIVSVDTEYSESYKNVTVSIEVEGTDGMKTIQCYRLKGEGADVIGVGDTITVTGVIKNYYGKVEFDAGCTLDAYVKAPAELPEGATAIDILGYTHDAFNYIMYADADMTLGELVTKYYGQSKDLNYFKVIVVNEDGTIDAVYLTLGRPDGVKTDFTVKAGQIVIALSANVPGYEVADSFKAGDTVVLHNIEIDTIKAATESTALTGVGFTVVPYVKPVVNGTFAEEGLNGVNQFAANAHNIWTGSVASIEWWTKALLQWNDEAQGWEVLKVQGNGKVDWVTEGNQIVIAAHADNGAAVASIAALQVGDIVYIWDIGVATSDKLSADVDCNGGFYTTDATKTGTTAFTYKEKVALAGDVNMDGVINDADYMIIRKLVVGTADAADYTDEQLKLADVNGNGAIDANDYLVVKRHALGTYVIPAWK